VAGLRSRLACCLVIGVICTETFAQAPDSGKPTYRLIAGKGYTVCEAYLRNLKAFRPDERAPVCAPRPHSTNKDFQEPRWEPMDILQHLAMIYRAEMSHGIYRNYPERHPPFEKWRQEFEGGMRSGAIQPSLKRARVEFRRGEPMVVVAYARNHAGCEADFARHGASENTGHRWFFYDESTQRLTLEEGVLGDPAGALLLFKGLAIFVGVEATGGEISLADQVTSLSSYAPITRCVYDVDDPARPLTMRKQKPVTK
jgi:hypothetical protein